jgi:hypothetical protein
MHERASSEHAWEPMASSSVNFYRKRAPHSSRNPMTLALTQQTAREGRAPDQTPTGSQPPTAVARGCWLLEREGHRTRHQLGLSHQRIHVLCAHRASLQRLARTLLNGAVWPTAVCDVISVPTEFMVRCANGTVWPAVCERNLPREPKRGANTREECHWSHAWQRFKWWSKGV